MIFDRVLIDYTYILGQLDICKQIYKYIMRQFDVGYKLYTIRCKPNKI